MSDKKQLHNYDTCIFGNGEESLNAAINKVHAGAHTALIHTKHDQDKDFAPKDTIILEALHASANMAQACRMAEKFGIGTTKPQIEWDKVQAHIKNAMDRITPHYSFDKLNALGVHIIKGPVQDEISSAKETIHESPPPPQPAYEGLDDTKTRRLGDITTWADLPEHVIILGENGKAISLAQSLSRLGCKATILSTGAILDGLDTELYKILFERFEYEGIRLIAQANITAIEHKDQEGQIVIHMMHDGAKRRVTGSDILVIPREQENHIFALSDPSIAQIGFNEDQAREKYGAGNFHITKWRYQESDFAKTQHQDNGLLKIITKTDGTVIGTGICGAQALDLIGPWSLAHQQSLKLTDMQDLLAPHSAYSRMSAQAIDGYIKQIANPARKFKPGSFWQGLIGA